MIEARKAGKYAIIKYDELIIKENRQTVLNKKRQMSTSPQQQDQPTGQPTKTHKKNKGEDSTNKKQGTLLKYSLPRKDQLEKSVKETENSSEEKVVHSA